MLVSRSTTIPKGRHQQYSTLSDTYGIVELLLAHLRKDIEVSLYAQAAVRLFFFKTGCISIGSALQIRGTWAIAYRNPACIIRRGEVTMQEVCTFHENCVYGIRYTTYNMFFLVSGRSKMRLLPEAVLSKIVYYIEYRESLVYIFYMGNP